MFPRTHQPGWPTLSLSVPWSSRATRDFVQVNLTMEDVGPLPEVDLASMVVVRGISSSGQSTILRTLEPVNNASYFFSNDKFSVAFVVAGPRLIALKVEILVDVALSTKLTIGQPVTSLGSPQNCSQGTLSEWYINESNLYRFTRGSQVLWSDWCPNNVNPYIDVGTSGISGRRLVPIPGQGFIRQTSRYDTLLLG